MSECNKDGQIHMLEKLLKDKQNQLDNYKERVEIYMNCKKFEKEKIYKINEYVKKNKRLYQSMTDNNKNKISPLYWYEILDFNKSSGLFF